MGTMELVVLPLCIACILGVAAVALIKIRSRYRVRIDSRSASFRSVSSLFFPAGVAGLALVSLFTGLFFLITG